MMQAAHGQVVDVKKIRTRQVVQIITEIPAEHYAQAVALLDDQQALITPSSLDIPFGVVDGSDSPKPKGQELKGGELSKWAAMRCQESDFRRWLAHKFMRECKTETDAKQLICDFCGIESRRELDHDAKANEIFKDMIMRPWSIYCGGLA